MNKNNNYLNKIMSKIKSIITKIRIINFKRTNLLKKKIFRYKYNNTLYLKKIIPSN